ncbi:LysR family transcriptional regulator [Romboutsia weinsteinii]|uniref:LysR family transcriptional regulator n=1 Tax=Romboutsia weinsteinii TaxID=2020949 RepID=A0A371J1T7_9FIRM|nr:LysR family transcriptional regulator [Romboutsia weinsteinii]RDY26675.1 LysR family transcriptional regulator [Romboutsia weinsteinii]
MNLDHLRSFYMTAKYKSISKSAKELHLTQPGLSMQLQNLESEMGTSLLKRSYRGVELTEEGKIVFEYANKVLSLEDDLHTQLRNLKNNVEPLLIGSCKSIGEYALPCSIYTFKQIHENIHISLELNNSSTVIKKLRNHDINIGIIQEHNIGEDIVSIPLLSDKLALVGGYDQPMNKITLDDLLDLQLILREEGSATRSILEDAFNKKGLDFNNLNVIYSLNSQEAIKNSISLQKCFSFLPEVSIRQELRSSTLKKISIVDLDIEFNYYVVYRKNYKLTKYEQIFIDFISSKKRCFCY